jgi:ankyrin repeat protein
VNKRREEKGKIVLHIIGNRIGENRVGGSGLESVHTSLHEATLAVDGAALLLSAALCGQTITLRTLLGKGAEVNARDVHGWTPLMEAVFAGQVEAVQVLLEHGAEVNAADIYGWTVLMEAASKGRREIVKMLISCGVDVQAKSKNGWTALRATQKGNGEIRKMLRRAGARS